MCKIEIPKKINKKLYQKKYICDFCGREYYKYHMGNEKEYSFCHRKKCYLESRKLYNEKRRKEEKKRFEINNFRIKRKRHGIYEWKCCADGCDEVIRYHVTGVNRTAPKFCDKHANEFRRRGMKTSEPKPKFVESIKELENIEDCSIQEVANAWDEIIEHYYGGIS